MKLLLVTLVLFILLKAVAYTKREDKDIDEDNPYIHPEAVEVLPKDMQTQLSLLFSVQSVQSDKKKRTSVYEHILKPILDILLSFFGLVLLSPVFILIIIAIKIDDPGPIFFKQKRVGKDKHFFLLHKFRSMKMSAPHDMPTHLLINPEQYITRVGKFLRRSSLDELPQIWDIFRGKMSIIGPRPALWNQADLVLEREQWGANDIKPGLTGLAQISGRDELDIQEKARIDGEYARNFSFNLDGKCFLDTIIKVLESDGIVEGAN